MTQHLAYQTTEFEGNTSLETILATTDGDDVGYKVGLSLNYAEKYQKTKFSPICPEFKKICITYNRLFERKFAT